MCLSLRHRLWPVQVLPALLFSEELFVAKPVGGGRLGIMVATVFQSSPSANCVNRLSETSPLSLENGAEAEENSRVEGGEGGAWSLQQAALFINRFYNQAQLCAELGGVSWLPSWTPLCISSL